MDSETARRHPHVANCRILSVRRHWREWIGLRTPDLNEQRLLLTQVAVQTSRGGLTTEALKKIVERLPTLRRNWQADKINSAGGLAPHELLILLNVHPFAIALCRSGERLGNVPDMLMQATDFLAQLHQMRQEIQGPLLRTGLYAGAAVGIFLVTPFLFQLLLERLSERVSIETTAATDILILFHALLTEHLPFTLLGVGISSYLLFYYWKHVRRIPLLRDIDELLRNRRSAVLLTILTPAFRKGIHLAELVRSLHSLLGRAASQHLYTRLRAGYRLSQSLSEKYFSDTLITGLHQFEDAPAEQLRHLFAAVQTNLNAEIKWYLTRVVRTTRWLYSALILCLLALLIQGFLLPIYSISVL